MRFRFFRSFVLAAVFASLTIVAFAKAKVSIMEWDVPTPKSFPHDPAVAPDGSLWYTGMHSDKLGRLDPATGKFKEYRLKTSKSGPHGLVADKEGNIWFTANYKSYIGRLDPRTGEVKEYSLPSSGDPHTPVFDQKGILWFTVQAGNSIGRLDPSTGNIRLKRAPIPDSRPYGIAVNSKGIPFFCELGANRLASISPDAMEITEYQLPKDTRPRRLAIASDDTIYYTDYARGRLGKIDPKTKKVDDWPSPGGNGSRPYGIAATPDGKVWYSESGVEPNTIVSFDPKTRKFESARIPSGGGVVRHMVATPKGDIYIACSGVNKVGIVKVSR